MVRPGREDNKPTSRPVSEATPIEVDEAVQQMMATMHGITTVSDSTTAALGPIPTGDVLLDGVRVQALLDTGSPVSIVSLDTFLQIAAKNRTSEQSPADWGNFVRSRLQPTTVTLKSYGSDAQNIASQVVCHLRRGDYSSEVVLQAQKGAPVDLLLGTDVLSRLGISLVQQDKERTTDLLRNTKQRSAEGPLVTVRLLHAARIPARHSKLVRVEVPDGYGAKQEMSLFEPRLTGLGQRGLTMPDAVVEVGEGRLGDLSSE